MSLSILFDSEYLNRKKIEKLWQLIASSYGCSNDIVNVQKVSEKQIQELNRKYREKNKITNVLTFSYGEGEHDISLCLVLAEKEAKQKNVVIEEYVGRLLVHAFLHVVGMDHNTVEEEKEMRQLEVNFLGKAGFVKKYL